MINYKIYFPNPIPEGVFDIEYPNERIINSKYFLIFKSLYIRDSVLRFKNIRINSRFTLIIDKFMTSNSQCGYTLTQTEINRKATLLFFKNNKNE